MATFKVGQRVRIAAHAMPTYTRGLEGVIARRGSWYTWIVNVSGFKSRFDFSDGAGTIRHRSDCPYDEHELLPLTDSGADAFMERIKKLAREPKPLEVVETLSQRRPLVWGDK